MDPRQRETLFRIVSETCPKENFQYICSINEDALLSFQSLMSDTEYEEIVTNNIILELNDDSPESKLLGIQIDIDLEDKAKSSDDITSQKLHSNHFYRRSKLSVYFFTLKTERT